MKEEQLKRDAKELANKLVDMVVDYIESKNYSPGEEAAVAINAVMMVTSFPLEYVPPSKRPEMIELFSSVTHRQMTEFNMYLRKENHEGN